MVVVKLRLEIRLGFLFLGSDGMAVVLIVNK